MAPSSIPSAPSATAGDARSGWSSWDPGHLGRRSFESLHILRGLAAFSLITLGVAVRKSRVARPMILAAVRQQIVRAGLRLLPMTTLLAVVLGLVVIGQTVALLTSVGAQEFAGTIMITVVVRELGPLIAALLVLVRVGTAYVIELGTARAQGELEALESLAIDPIHYLVIPRVTGLALSVFSLTIYFILAALASGYLFAFVQDVPLTPAYYVQQLAGALGWLDFILLGLKTVGFGAVVAIVTCYEGLARPLRLEDVGEATTQAVVQTVMGFVLLDALFIIIYLIA